MQRIASLVFGSLAFISLSACGDDGGPRVIIEDADIADAFVAPDAAPCAFTMCDGICTDTSKDSQNCGGCGMACDSPGQICSGSLPCECPENFLTPQLGGGPLNQIEESNGTYFALTALSGASGLHLAAVMYDLDLETGVTYDLAQSSASLSTPLLIAAYQVDIATQTAKTPYGSVSGSITFDTLCAGGASGTATNVSFREAELIGLTPMILEDGCTMDYKSLEFDIGSCPDEGEGDGGAQSPADAGM